jgi:hypothetical protein
LRCAHHLFGAIGFSTRLEIKGVGDWAWPRHQPGFGNGRPGRLRSCVVRLSTGCSAIELQDGNRLERRTLVTPLEVFIGLIDCDLGFDSKSHRAESKPHLHRANSDGTAWFVTAPWEQLALVSDHRFHWFLLSGSPTTAGITDATALDIRQDCHPERRSASGSVSAVLGGLVGPFC